MAYLRLWPCFLCSCAAGHRCAPRGCSHQKPSGLWSSSASARLHRLRRLRSPLAASDRRPPRPARTLMQLWSMGYSGPGKYARSCARGKLSIPRRNERGAELRRDLEISRFEVSWVSQISQVQRCDKVSFPASELWASSGTKNASSRPPSSPPPAPLIRGASPPKRCSAP